MMPMPPTSRLTSAMPASSEVIVSAPSICAAANSARLRTEKSSSAPRRIRWRPRSSEVISSSALVVASWDAAPT